MQNFIISLIVCSVSMSAVALLYMVVTPFLAKRYSERGRFYAWLIIVVGFIIPFRPQWGNALVNVEVPGNTPTPVVQISNGVSTSMSPIDNAVISATTLNFSWWQIAAVIWLAGMIIFIVYHGIKHYSFVKMARRWGENITNEHTLSLFQSIKSEMGVTRHIPLYLCPFVGSPMMVGLIKPRILLPKVELEKDELCFILRHELVHCKRKDLLYKHLVLIATAIHWFNPIVYLIAKAVNALCEVSCDSEIVQSADMDTRQSYSETIIGVVKYQSKLKTALSTNFYGGKKGMKNRISSIMDTRKKKAGIIITCLVLTLALGTGFVLAASPAQTNDSYMAWPVPGFYLISSEYGIRYDGADFHMGIDISGEGIRGAPVVAADDGTVVHANTEYTPGQGYGMFVIIAHENNISTLYGHLSEIQVSVGDTVDRGQAIAKVGSTGFSAEPHLQFEVRENGEPVDPVYYLILNEQ